MASKRNQKWKDKELEAEGSTALDFESTLAGKLAKENTISDSPPTEEVEEKREQLRAITDLPETVEGNQPAEAVEVTDSTENAQVKEVIEPTSFEDLLESAKTVDEKKALEEMSKQYSGKKLIIRKPVKGIGWEAQPRKEGEGPLTVEQSQQLCDVLNAHLKELKPEKKEATSNPEEELASLIAVIEDISNSEKLKEFAERCAQASSPLLHGGSTERGFWVKPIRGSEISKKLVDAINKRKAELAQSERIERLINEIEEVEDPRQLEASAYTLHKLELITKITTGQSWKVEAIEGVEGSKKLVKAIIKRRSEISTFREQMKAIESKKSGGELEKTAQRLHYAGYVIKKGEKENFTVTSGKKFGGEELAEAIMEKKKIFLNPILKASMGAVLAEHLGKK